MTDDEKKKIDDMTQFEMADRWRFGSGGNRLLHGDAGEYFKKIFQEKGGMTPEISKELGWEK